MSFNTYDSIHLVFNQGYTNAFNEIQLLNALKIIVLNVSKYRYSFKFILKQLKKDKL